MFDNVEWLDTEEYLVITFSIKEASPGQLQIRRGKVKRISKQPKRRRSYIIQSANVGIRAWAERLIARKELES